MISKRNLLLLLLILALIFYCLDFYYRISQSIVVSNLMQQYHIKTLGVGAFASAFYLGYAIFQIPSGLLLDRFNFNKVCALTISICALAYIGFVWSHHFWLGYSLRLLVGASSAMSFVSVLFLARRFFSPKNFSFIAGIAIGLGTLAASFVQVIGAYLLKYFNWHIIFTVLALIAVVIATILLIPSYHLSRDQVAVEKITWQKLFNILKTPVLTSNAIIGSLFYLPTTIFASLWGVPFLEQDYHFSKTDASFGIMLLFLGWAIGSPFVGYIAGKMRHAYQLILLGALIGCCVSFLLIYTSIFYQLVYLLLFLFGLSSSAQSVVWRIFDIHCPRSLAGFGVSLTNMIIMLSGMIFHLLVGYLLSLGVFTVGHGQINYQLGLAIIPIAFFIVAGLSLVLRSKQI